MSEKLERFTDLLKQIFELDKSDLDFGIYRIMNIRKDEIEKFLTEGLPDKVRETLAPFAQGDQTEIKQQIAEIEKNAVAFGMDVNCLPEDNPMGKKYRDLQKQLAEGTDLAAMETDVYSALYSFFNRYYEDGDFISKRRYKEGVYAIPYEGEEVKLYWANQDQYYIKTSENFKDYSFLVGDYAVHFRLVDATTEQNNNKEAADSKRTFMLFSEDEENYPGIKTFEYNDNAKELIIRFVFDIPEDKKKKYLDENYQAIRKYVFESQLPMWQDLLAPIPTGKGKETTDLLLKHLNGYVAKNTFDYFIHKDLRGFLTRELDFYIKTEIMHLDDLDTDNVARVETYLAKIKAIKRVGKTIIDFLAQVEDFQKKLWLKKKFVVETNWCITLDKIDERFYPEIAANQEQMAEWIEMYAVDEIEPQIGVEGWTNPPSMEFLKQNKNLIIDTKYFSNEFTNQITESIDNLDRETNGLMINSDNYHALHLIQNRYENRISCIYIDPPYNSDASPILYKNGYKSSSWCSMMDDRLQQSQKLLNHSGVIAVAIDDVQKTELDCIMRNVFPVTLGTICVRSNPSGRPMQTGYSVSHEYTLYAGASEDSVIGRTPPTNAQMSRFKEMDKNGAYEWRNLRREGSNSDRTSRPGLYYPIFINGKQIRIPDMEWVESNKTWKLISLPEYNDQVVYPINDDGIEKTWRWGPDKVKSDIDLLSVRKDRSGKDYIYYKRYPNTDGVATVSSWFEAKYSATEHGTALLKDMFMVAPFSYPKSIYLVMDSLYISGFNHKKGICIDFFAGSGTTAHATINLNRIDNGERKYILVETENYFESVTKVRVQKAVYADNWKNGKPENRKSGISQIIKCIRLESYEDALSNIELNDDTHQMSMLLGDEYLIHYMLDLESKDSLLDVDAFENPFEYKMKITEKNECKERNVDLCETFNYLIGLSVIRQSAISYFAARTASNPSYEGAVELLKDLDGEYAFRQIEGILPDGRRALVIWRTITDDLLASNAALDAYFSKYRINPQDREYDIIFVNGDNNLENLRTVNESWKVQLTEIEFKKRMFEEA